MATIRKRGSKWHAQVRRSGHPTQTRSFTHKADAEAWARKSERQIDSGDTYIRDVATLRSMTVSDLLRRYQGEVLPYKKSASVEGYIVGHFLRHSFFDNSLENLTATEVSGYRDVRLRSVKPGTVHREMAVLRHCFEVARRDWGVPLQSNPVAEITMPKPSKARNRRALPEEVESLINGCRHQLLRPIIIFAIETGMRRGEIVAMLWNDLDLDAGTLHIPITKNGSSRTIPLTIMALQVLEGLPRTDERIFPISGNAIRLAWERLKKRVGIVDLRFHDLRHEAISRFFEMGLSVPEVALISGHKDPRMLFRYTHLRAEDVAKKLRGVDKPEVTSLP